MAGVQAWSQQCIEEFFENYDPLAQAKCDDAARFITGASSTLPVGMQGSLSYTVICSGRPEKQEDLIVSFRLLQCRIDDHLVKIAKEIHGDLVPEATDHSLVSDLNPPLAIYTMPYLPGISGLEALSDQIKVEPQDEIRHICFIKHPAR